MVSCDDDIGVRTALNGGATSEEEMQDDTEDLPKEDEQQNLKVGRGACIYFENLRHLLAILSQKLLPKTLYMFVK